MPVERQLENGSAARDLWPDFLRCRGTIAAHEFDCGLPRPSLRQNNESTFAVARRTQPRTMSAGNDRAAPMRRCSAPHVRSVPRSA